MWSNAGDMINLQIVVLSVMIQLLVRMNTQWEKFFETTSFRRRIDLANSHFDVVSTAYFDGEATSICEFDTKSHFAVKSILFFTIAFVSTVHFEGEATSICDFDTKSHYAEKKFSFRNFSPSFRRRNATSFRRRKSPSF